MTIPVGFAQATHFFTGNPVPLGAAITYGVDLGGASPTPESVAEDLHGALATTVMGRLPQSLFLQSTLVKFGPDATGPSGTFSTAVGGSLAGDVAPPNVTWLVRKNTALGGRAGRGRLYLPGVPEELIDNGGVISATDVTAMQTEWDDFLIAVGAANLNMVVLHQPGSPLITPTPITSLQVEGRVATQRTRLRK